MFQLPTTLPFASFVNDKIAFSQREGIVFQYNQALQSFAGDPSVGQLAGNTQIPWNKTSEVQGLIVEYYAVQGEEQNPQNPPYPADLQQILEANAGPTDEKWNFSYEQWGLVPGVPGVAIVLAVEVGTGRGVDVIVP